MTDDDGTLVRFEADVRTTSPKDAPESTLRNASKSRAFRYNNIVCVRCSCRRVPCERTLEISIRRPQLRYECVYTHTRELLYSLSLLASRTKGARVCTRIVVIIMYTRRDARARTHWPSGHGNTNIVITPRPQWSARFFRIFRFFVSRQINVLRFLGFIERGKKIIHVIFIVIYFNEKLYYIIIYCVIKKLDSKNIYFFSYLKQFLIL